MALTKAEQATIENLIKRLQAPNCGCSNGFDTEKIVADANEAGIEAVSRLYLNTWVIPALQLLLPGEKRNPDLAQRLSGR